MGLALKAMAKTDNQDKSNRKQQNQPVKSVEELSARSQIEVFHISAQDPHKKLLSIDSKRSINMLLHVEVHNSPALTIEGTKETVTLENSCKHCYHEHTIAVGVETDLEAVLESEKENACATIRILEVY